MFQEDLVTDWLIDLFYIALFSAVEHSHWADTIREEMRVSSWILTPRQPHRVTSGRITHSTFLYTSSKHKSLNHKCVQFAVQPLEKNVCQCTVSWYSFCRRSPRGPVISLVNMSRVTYLIHSAGPHERRNDLVPLRPVNHNGHIWGRNPHGKLR